MRVLTETALAEAAEALTESAPMRELRDDLTQAWANSNDLTMLAVLGAFIRAAYGCGYTDGLVNHPERYTPE